MSGLKKPKMLLALRFIGIALFVLAGLLAQTQEGTAQFLQSDPERLVFDPRVAQGEGFPAEAVSDQSGLRFSFGADLFSRYQSEIHGINMVSMVYAFPFGIYVGNSVYSSAFGTGGGFFVGGIETGFRLPVSRRTGIQLGAFIGGGGGANQVGGDGLMLRTHASLAVELYPGWWFTPGVSYTSVSGSEISTAGLHLGLTRNLNLAISDGFTPRDRQDDRAFRVTSFKPVYRLYLTGSSEKRDPAGRPLDNMHTIGAEITFSNTDWYEIFIQTHGVVAGDAEGYADWFAGYRLLWNLSPFRLFASLGTGSAGGGAVNSGGGQVYLLGAGLSLPAWRGTGLELEAMAVRSFNGDFTTVAPGLRIVRYLSGAFDHRAEKETYRWAVNTGMVMHIPNSTYRQFGDRRGPLVFMIESALDLMISRNFYITGRGYTSFIGDAGGYQIGLLGPGFVHTLPNKWQVKAEVYIGAGGGARVDTQGGLLTGMRAELGVPVWRSLHLTAGAGTLTPVLGRGMNPITLHTGLSVPFRTYH